MFTNIKLERLSSFTIFLLTTTAEATEYVVSSAPGDQAGASIKGEKVVNLRIP